MLEFRILGPLDALDDGAPLPLGGPRQRALLAVLLLNSGRTVSTSRLIDDLWGEDVPDTAAKMVQIHVSQLRKVLPAGILTTRPPGYQLDVDPEAIDLARFERLLAGGREALAGGDALAATGQLREALGLWRGPALAEFSEPFAATESARLEERRLTALEERIEADLALGRHADLVPEIEALVARHPLRERLHGQRMLALYRSGRQAEALAAYQEARRTLSDELGIEPSAPLRELERRILQQDAALDVPPAPAAAAPGAPLEPTSGQPMVGREAEITALEGHLAQAQAGERRLVVVEGEAGAGKSTLVEAFLRARAGAALVGRGQCVEQHGASEAYMPVLEALDDLCRARGGAAVSSLLAERAPTWLVQMPWLVEPGALERLQQRVLGATRDRMLREMVEAVRALAADRLVVLVLEDLHWSDLASLDLLTALARRREPARLLVIATCRSADAASRAHPVHAAVTELAARGLCHELTLDPLDEAQVSEYLRARLPGVELPSDVLGTLRARTAGNPLFLEKAVDAWIEQDKVREQDGRWQLAAEAPELARTVPSSVRQLIRQRLLSVAPDDRRVLEAASVAAPEFSSSLVAAAAEMPDDEAEERCDALARDGVFLVARGAESWPDGTVSGRYAFSHDLCNEVLYEDLPPGRRARLHVAVGARLERAHGERPAEVAATLAAHFVRGGDAARAVRHLRAAAAQALERLAPREAIDLASTGLELLAGLPAGAERDEHELALQVVLGPTLIQTRGWSSADAERAFRRAGELAAGLGRADEVAWSEFKLATLYEVRGEYPRSEEILEGLLAQPEPALGAPAQLDSYELLACSLFHQGEFGRACENAELGLQVYDGVSANAFVAPFGDNPGVACHSWAALALWFLGRPDAGRARAAQAVSLAGEERRRHGLATALAQAAVVSQCRREPEEAVRWCDEARKTAEREGYRYRVAMATIVRGWALAMLGEAGDGPAELRRGIEHARATGARMDDAYFLGLLAEALLATGDRAGARAALDEAAEAIPRGGRFFYEAELARLRGRLLREEGDLEAAEGALRHALATARDQGGRSLELRAAVDLGALLRATGRPREAQALVAAAYGGFSEGFDTPDLRAAAEFLGDGGDGAARAPEPRAPGEPPPIRYAASGDLSIAYEVTGDGPVDLVLIPGFVSHLEQDRREPRHLRFLERLASFSRLIRFDKRGTGLSDRPPGVPDLETRMDDLRAVMDAAGCERAVLFGYSEGGPLSVLFAATYPERVAGLVLFGSFAKRVEPDDDYPWAATREEREAHIASLTGDWGFELHMRRMCPSADEAMARWWGERGRAAASPGALAALLRMNSLIDVRGALPAVQAPTLVVHRGGDPRVRGAEGRYMADRIPGARYVELAGADHFVGIDPDQILDVVEPFVRSLPGAPVPVEEERGYATAVAALGEDGPVVSVFDGPTRAVRSGIAAARGSAGTPRRVGVHTGQIARTGGPPAGPAVEVAARVAEAAAPGEALVTATTRDLVPGSGLAFEDRGERRLGEAGPRRLFAAREEDGGGGADPPGGEAGARPVASAAFVGREAEIGRLTAALDVATAGDGRLVMLSGEPGIGKSRTAAELAALAGGRGIPTLWGRCHERQGAPPYLPWTQVLREIVRDAPADALAADAGAGAAEVASLVPELRKRLPGIGEPAAAGDPEQARFRLLDAVASFLAAVSARGPLVIVLEDLHAADSGSLDLLEFVARALPASRLLVIGTYRDGEVPAGHPLAASLAELSGEGPLERIALRGLGRDEVARVIVSACGTAPSAEMTETAWSHTEGNPLFLLELVRLLAQEGPVDQAADRARAIPEGVRSVIGRRLARLSDPCNDVLRVAAVSGRRFGLRELVAARDGGDEDEVLEALEEALAARVVDEEPGSPGRYLFSHALIRETLLEGMSAVRRARLHARMGAALEELHGPAADAHAAELLHHFAQAEAVLGAEPLVRYATLAGEAALAARAYDEAAARFREALAAHGGGPVDATAARIHFGLGRALLASRELHELDEAVASLELAFDHHVEAGDAAAAIAIASHPLTPNLMYEPTGVSRLVSRALELAPPDSPDAARLLSTGGWLTGIGRADADAAQRAFDEAVAIARRAGDAGLEVRALVNAQYVQMFHMRWEESRGSGRRAVELAVPAGDRRSEAAARGWLARAAAREGDLATARREVAAATPHAESLRELYWRATSGLHNAMTAALEGDWERAREWGEAGLAVRRRDPRILGLLALVEHETGELSAGEARLGRLRGLVDAVPPPGPGAEHPFAAAFVALSDRVADAEDHLELAERAGAGVLALDRPLPYLAFLASIGLGLVAVRRRDAAAAERHLVALSPYEGTASFLPPLAVDRLLGLLELTAGRTDEGIARLLAALAFAERAGYGPESAWTSFELATSLRERAAADDAAAAEAHRARALRIARELGMNALAGRLAVAV